MWELLGNSNLTLSAPPDGAEFESLESIAFFRTASRTQPPCLLHRAFAEREWQRRRSRDASFTSASAQVSGESYADTDASDARLTPSSNGSDVAGNSIEKNVPRLVR